MAYGVVLEPSREQLVSRSYLPSLIAQQTFFTVATAGSFSELKDIMPNYKLPKGARIRFIMELSLPVAPAFDLWGAEAVFRPFMPDGLTLIDVWGEGSSTAVIEAEANSPLLIAIAAFLARHWLTLSLLAIGITLALGFLISAIRVDVTEVVKALPSLVKWGVIGVLGFGTLLLAREYVKKSPTR